MARGGPWHVLPSAQSLGNAEGASVGIEGARAVLAPRNNYGQFESTLAERAFSARAVFLTSEEVRRESLQARPDASGKKVPYKEPFKREFFDELFNDSDMF